MARARQVGVWGELAPCKPSAANVGKEEIAAAKAAEGDEAPPALASAFDQLEPPYGLQEGDGMYPATG